MYKKDAPSKIRSEDDHDYYWIIEREGINTCYQVRKIEMKEKDRYRRDSAYNRR